MKTTKKTDKELVTLLTKDNEAAFCELYVCYKDKLVYFSFSLLKLKEEANDIVQEIFTRLWESRSSINPDLSFSSFLYTMTRNRILNHFRDANIDAEVKKILFRSVQVEEDIIESDMIYTEYRKILNDAIEDLPPQRKRIFNMSRSENLSHKEIAAQLGISTNTVQEHISEALKFIKSYFSKHADLTFGILLWLTIS